MFPSKAQSFNLPEFYGKEPPEGKYIINSRQPLKMPL